MSDVYESKNLGFFRNFHEIISKKITTLLDSIYYNNLKKIYNRYLESIKTVPELDSGRENAMKESNQVTHDANLPLPHLVENINDVFRYSKFPVIKPEYFIYIQYYFIYTFFYYISSKNLIMYSISLHLIHISGIIFDDLVIKYNYVPVNNINFLKESSYLLFMYLFFFKILFLKIILLKRLFLLYSFYTFYIVQNINYIYKERLKYIELKKDFIHPLKILIISPNKEFIENMINNTRFFTYTNYLLFINILLYIVL